MKTAMSYAVMIAVGCAWAACDKNPNTVRTDSTGAPTTTAPDNTGINKRDQNTGTVTPVDQSESAADIKITADIRRSVMDDNSLSTNAHNVKIITGKGGVVNGAAS